jgi:hypothetical protein
MSYLFLLLPCVCASRCASQWAAGVRPSEMMLSHVITQLVMVAIQIALLIAVAVLVFAIPCHGSVLTIMGLTVSLAMAGMLYGLFLSSICNDENECVQYSTGSFFPVMLLSGILWPVEGTLDINCISLTDRISICFIRFHSPRDVYNVCLCVYVYLCICVSVLLSNPRRHSRLPQVRLSSDADHVGCLGVARPDGARMGHRQRVGVAGLFGRVWYAASARSSRANGSLMTVDCVLALQSLARIRLVFVLPASVVAWRPQS